MIILEDSEEAINGLAKLIIQEPRIIPELKLIRKHLKGSNSLSSIAKDDNYYEETLKIISKAEDIANKEMWYGFSLHDTFNGDDNGFMLYKVMDKTMVPLEKDFEGGWNSRIKDFSDLEQIIEDKNIKNLLTYDVRNFDKVYSQQYEIEDVEEGNPIDYKHQHLSISRTFLNVLREKGINVTEYNEEQVKVFERDLKQVIDD